MSTGKTTEEKMRIIQSLQGLFKLKDILAVAGFLKSAHMYWKKRLDWGNQNQEIENRILEICN